MGYHKVTDDEITKTLTVLAEQNRTRVPRWSRCCTRVPRLLSCSVDEITAMECAGVYSTRGASFWPPSRRMGFGSAVGEHDVIHEFTHYLLADHGWIGRSNMDAHSRPFYDALRVVVRRYYGDGNERMYLWRNDYLHIQEWATRDGLM